MLGMTEILSMDEKEFRTKYPMKKSEYRIKLAEAQNNIKKAKWIEELFFLFPDLQYLINVGADRYLEDKRDLQKTCESALQDIQHMRNLDNVEKIDLETSLILEKDYYLKRRKAKDQVNFLESNLETMRSICKLIINICRYNEGGRNRKYAYKVIKLNNNK